MLEAYVSQGEAKCCRKALWAVRYDDTYGRYASLPVMLEIGSLDTRFSCRASCSDGENSPHSIGELVCINVEDVRSDLLGRWYVEVLVVVCDCPRGKETQTMIVGTYQVDSSSHSISTYLARWRNGGTRAFLSVLEQVSVTLTESWIRSILLQLSS